MDVPGSAASCAVAHAENCAFSLRTRAAYASAASGAAARARQDGVKATVRRAACVVGEARGKLPGCWGGRCSLRACSALETCASSFLRFISEHVRNSGCLRAPAACQTAQPPRASGRIRRGPTPPDRRRASNHDHAVAARHADGRDEGARRGRNPRSARGARPEAHVRQRRHPVVRGVVPDGRQERDPGADQGVFGGRGRDRREGSRSDVREIVTVPVAPVRRRRRLGD
mmetsp:Transcript_30295/g.91045  ORF Transcript_30295/g.91045 Transcript_30295/m.91045 type:complete len:229 (-) Transcript_30295:267-953(-)